MDIGLRLGIGQAIVIVGGAALGGVGDGLGGRCGGGVGLVGDGSGSGGGGGGGAVEAGVGRGGGGGGQLLLVGAEELLLGGDHLGGLRGRVAEADGKDHGENDLKGLQVNYHVEKSKDVIALQTHDTQLIKGTFAYEALHFGNTGVVARRLLRSQFTGRDAGVHWQRRGAGGDAFIYHAEGERAHRMVVHIIQRVECISRRGEAGPFWRGRSVQFL